MIAVPGMYLDEWTSSRCRRWPTRPFVHLRDAFATRLRLLWLRAIPALSLLLLLGCDSEFDKAEIDRARTSLHQELSSGRYKQIYDSADASMHNAIDAAAFERTMRTVATKLGHPLSSTLQKWGQTLSFPLGRTITAEYLTRFEKGEGTEHITWRLRDNKLVLVGYYVNSPIFEGAQSR